MCYFTVNFDYMKCGQWLKDLLGRLDKLYTNDDYVTGEGAT